MTKNFMEDSNLTREELEELYYEEINMFKEEVIDQEENFNKYRVQLQEVEFTTYMTDQEVRYSIKYALDLLELLRKRFIEDGITKEVLEKWEQEAELERKDKLTFLREWRMWDKLVDDTFRDLLIKIQECKRVGGAYAMLLALPKLKSAIYAVYEKIVEDFEDKTLQNIAGFFLVRAIMYMNSEAEEKNSQDSTH